MGESQSLLPRVEKALEVLRGVRVHRYVDFGCGDGSITEAVAKFVGAEEVYGVDIDGTALAKAIQRGIRVLSLDLSRDEVPPDSASVDLATAFEVIKYLPNLDNVLREAYRILRPGGYLLITTPNLTSWVNRPPGGTHLPSP